MDKKRLLFSPWLTLRAFIKYYLIYGEWKVCRSKEVRISHHALDLCLADSICHNMLLIYARPQEP